MINQPELESTAQFYCNCVGEQTTWVVTSQWAGSIHGLPIIRYNWTCLFCDTNNEIGVWDANGIKIGDQPR
jgi:hypothetical protein